MSDIIGLIFIGIGLAFDLFGCLGLVRLPDVYNRLQASTKCVTIGTCSILFGTFLIVGGTACGMKALLCIIFLILTSPVAAHAIARAAHRAQVNLCPESVVDRYAEDKEGEKPVKD
ncbi:MAG: monovalent cation/H(+) antiporter subunit G [Candidatus Omnitrophica bacterium]|nr:monovalent cation/H(+) antiporter subunit G [Candidatus Omnitrophota bacterium]